MDKLNFNTGTKFQKKVWIEISKIPKGVVLTYQELATKIGASNCIRAVANACGKNPFIYDIPCHRVVRKDGKLGGYSGKGGIKKKKELLKKEGHIFIKDKIILKNSRKYNESISS